MFFQLDNFMAKTKNQIGKSNKRKGAVGERELANILKNKYGYNTRRGQQHGGYFEADVVGLSGIHIECKRCRNLQIYKWIEQAKNDKRDGEIPVVMFRRDKQQWLVFMELDDFMEMYNDSH